MTHVIPVAHKQIAFISYDPEEGTLVVAYHRGTVVRHNAVDKEQFQSVLHSINKVDALIQVLSKRFGKESDARPADSGYTGT